MPGRPPIILTEEIYRLRHISDPHVAIDDGLKRRHFFDSGINSSRPIRAKQDRIFDHQARILDRCRRRVAHETFALDKVAPSETGNFTEVFDVLDSGKLQCLLKYRKVFHWEGLLS